MTIILSDKTYWCAQRLTTNCFQFGGLLKTISLLGSLCQQGLSFTHAKLLLAILLDGIAQVFLLD
jgi:hypothetical protein